MTTTLTKLRGLILTYASDDLIGLSNEEIEHVKASIEELVNSLIWKIDDEFSREKDPALILYVQSKLTFLADSLTSFDRDQEETPSMSDLSMFILKRIFKVLYHLKVYYPTYFNTEADLPQHLPNFFYNENSALIDALKVVLLQKQADPKLVDLLKSFFSATSKGDRYQIRHWRQLDFQRNLFQSVKAQIEIDEEDLTLGLLKLFIAEEFNSIQIYGYFVKYLESITMSDLSAPEQQQKLIYLAKVFQQVRVDAQAKFDPNAPSLKSSVIESIQAELDYIDETEKIYMQSFRETNPEAPTKFYFKVAITIAELMFFFRIALEVKVIMTKFNAYLYEFVSNHIQTERAENISKKSMRNHFNNKPFPDKVVRVVRLWLTRMIEHIDLYYKF